MDRKGVHIEKNLYLESDEYQFIIKKYTGKFDKNGKETFVTIGYPGSLEQVAKKIYMLKIKETTATNIQELVDDHKKIMKEIRENFNMKGLLDK